MQRSDCLNRFSVAFLQVDERSDQHGGEIIGQVLKAHGVEHLFMLGSKKAASSPILRGAEKNGIKVIQTKQEVTAIAAADSTSRMTGLPGIAVITSAPGLNDTIAAIDAARHAESALVLIGMSSSHIMREEHLEVSNQRKTLKGHVKWTGRVDRVRDIAYELREALRQALHGVPGPVYMEFTLDCLNPYPVVKAELDGRGTNWFLDYYIKNLFAAGFDVGREIRPWPIEIPFPKKEQVSKIVKSITKSERPLVIMGSQAVLPPIEESKIATILQDMGIPCYFQGLARGILSKNHNLYMKQGLDKAIEGADLVLVLGVPADFKPDTRVSSKAQLFAVNRNKVTLKANSKNFGDKAVHVHSDVGQFLVEVSEKLGRFAISNEWLEGLRAAQNRSSSSSPSDAGKNNLPDKMIVVSDTADHFHSCDTAFHRRGPWLQVNAPGIAITQSGLVGWVMGAKLARRDHHICLLTRLCTEENLLSQLTECNVDSQNVDQVSCDC